MISKIKSTYRQIFHSPISENWKSLTKGRAVVLVIAGLLLEIPIRWIVRPDIPSMMPGNPWFDLPLRFSIELALLLVMIPLAWTIRSPLKALALTFRRWTKWEWIAFAVVGSIEFAIVILVAGERWPNLLAAGVLGRALIWGTAEFFFGFNQESVFRGVLMSGLLRLTGPVWATILNTLIFLVGPIHGPGLLGLAERNPTAAAWMFAGVLMTGLFFSWLRWRTDNIILCGALHGIVNGFLNGAAFARRAYLL